MSAPCSSVSSAMRWLSASRRDPSSNNDVPASSRVLSLVPYGSSDVTQATVVDPFCHEVSGSPGMVTPLSDEGMDAWAQDGLPVTLYGLIGPMG